MSKRIFCCLAVAMCLFGVWAMSVWAQEATLTYKNQGKRDPFIPLISPAGFLLDLEPKKNDALGLEGIMYDPKGDSMAIINGELIKAGDAIGDVLVVKIEQGKVTVVKNNETRELELGREE